MDDAAAHLLHHLRGNQLAAHVDRLEVDGDGAPPVLERVVQYRVRRRIDRRVVDQHVDATELADHIGDDLAVAVVVGHIESVWKGLAAGCLDFVGDCRTGLGIALQQHDLRAFARHLKRDGSAQALAGTGDEADPVVKQTHSGTPAYKPNRSRDGSNIELVQNVGPCSDMPEDTRLPSKVASRAQGCSRCLCADIVQASSRDSQCRSTRPV